MNLKAGDWIVHTRTNLTYYVLGTLQVKIGNTWVEHVKYINAGGKEYARKPADMLTKFTLLEETQT